MKGKKGLTAAILVIITVMLLSFVVLAKLDLHIISFAKAVAEGGVCAWSAVFASMGKVSGAETIKIVCPQRFVTITQSEAGKDRKSNFPDEEFLYINKKIPSSLRKKLANWYPAYEEKEDKDYMEYRMNEIMAKEIKHCWNKLGRGDLDLFSDWFSIVEYEEGTLKSDDGKLERFFKKVYPFNKDVSLTKKACIICSRVRFDDSVKAEFGADVDPELEITTLPDWMKSHPLSSYDPTSYYEFTLDESIISDFFAEEEDKDRLYYKPGDDSAVVFMRINIHRLVEIASDIADFIEEEDHLQAIDSVFIWPYAEVVDKCDAIMN